MKKGTQLKKNMDFITEELEVYAVIIFLLLKNKKPLSSKNFATTKYLIGAELLLNFGR